MNKYKVIKPYTSYYYGFPITIPVGAELEWFDCNRCYLSGAVNGYCVPITKWAAEGWHDYFEAIQ